VCPWEHWRSRRRRPGLPGNLGTWPRRVPGPGRGRLREAPGWQTRATCDPPGRPPPRPADHNHKEPVRRQRALSRGVVSVRACGEGVAPCQQPPRRWMAGNWRNSNGASRLRAWSGTARSDRDPRWGLRQMRAALSGRDAAWVTYSTTPGIQDGMRMSVTAIRAPVVLEPASQASSTTSRPAVSMTAGLHIHSRHARRNDEQPDRR
jgi:hypothetical protein